MKSVLLAGITLTFATVAWAASPTPTPTATAKPVSHHSAVKADRDTHRGVVTTHKSGHNIVINENNNPATFVLGKTVHYVDKAGHEIDQKVVQPGKRVILHLVGVGKERHVERVEVED